MDQARNVKYSDWLGASASGLCLIHCALSPFIFTAKPVFYGMIGRPIHTHGFWAELDYVFLIISLLAVWYSARHAHNIFLRWVLWAAWVAFAIGLLFEPYALAIGHGLMYFGSVILVVAHIVNYFQGQQHSIIEASN